MPKEKSLWDLSSWMDELARDLGQRVPELKHLRPEALLFALSRSRAEGTHGVYARIAPLRFETGASETSRRRGRYLETFRMPSLTHEGRQILYVIYLMVPRFLRLSFEQKLNTIIHELYHISETCDGDIRRFPGRNFAHGASREGYNRIIQRLAATYLAADPDPELLAPLHLTEDEWRRGNLQLTGLSVPLPRARLVARTRL